MNFFSAIDISASGLIAQRLRMNIISENIAKIDVVQEEGKESVGRKEVVLAVKDFSSFLKDVKYRPQGVEVVDIVRSKNDVKMTYNPTHPYADKDGFVSVPNINVLTEMAEMMSATRAYEANVTAISSAKEMIIRTLEIGK